MFEKNDKRYLYWILELYLSNRIDETSFCDAYYSSYNFEIDNSSLTELEQDVFSSIFESTERYTTSEEDLKESPDFFIDAITLRTNVAKNWNKLNYRIDAEKHTVRFLTLFFKIFNAYITEVTLDVKIKGIIRYEIDRKTQLFEWQDYSDKRLETATEILETVFFDKDIVICKDQILLSQIEIVKLFRKKGWPDSKTIAGLEFLSEVHITLLDEEFPVDCLSLHF
ncbi:MAG: hypothetical protein J6Y78_17640 [Paludibacteraceae bacterium]|nr:hypothetical protein [Paludibacteraceae bacterium]